MTFSKINRIRIFSCFAAVVIILTAGCAQQINDDNTGVPIDPAEVTVRTDGSVDIHWTTSEATLGAVEYGTGSAPFYRYAYTAGKRYDTIHTVRVFKLAADSQYFFRVRGITETGHVLFSAKQTFTVHAVTYNPAVMKVHMINVSGSGDCFYMEMPNGRTILYDAGSSSGGTTIVNYLNSVGCTTIDYAVLTHAHSDHYGNYSNGVIPSHFTINNFFYPDSCDFNLSTYDYVFSQIRNYNPSAVQYKLARGNSSSNTPVLLMDPSVQITVMCAGADGLAIDPGNSGTEEDTRTNSQSLVMKFQFGQARILMTGDLEQEAYRAYIQTNPATNPEADILKVSHHIRDDGVNINILNAIKPKIAIACTQSSANCSGLMQCPALNNLLDYNIDVFRSDAADPNLNRARGNDAKYYSHVLITTDGSTILVQTGI